MRFISNLCWVKKGAHKTPTRIKLDKKETKDLFSDFFSLFLGTLGNKTNSIYCLDLNTYHWINCASSGVDMLTVNNSNSGKVRKVDGYRPEPRYGHSQITLDDERILIIGE